MKQQIINILENNSVKVSDSTGYYKVLEDDMFPRVAEEIKKDYNPIHFARWILKHADTYTSEDGSFCWKYGKKKIDTTELYELYLKDLNGELE